MNKNDIKQYVKSVFRGTIPAMCETEFLHIYEDKALFINGVRIPLTQEQMDFMHQYSREIAYKATSAIK